VLPYSIVVSRPCVLEPDVGLHTPIAFGDLLLGAAATEGVRTISKLSG
jgi:hypothetical protein